MSTTQAAASANVQAIVALYEAFARGDVATVLAGMDPQIEWISAEGSPYPGTFVGPEAVLNGVFANLGQDWSDFQVATSEFLDAGDHVITLGRYRGTLRATGRSMDAAFAHVWTLRDGLITRFRQYADTRKMAEAY